MVIVDIYEKSPVKSKDVNKFYADITIDGKVQRFEVEQDLLSYQKVTIML